MGTANFETWDSREHLSSAATLADAIRAGRNEAGRTLTIFDCMGRIAVRMRDGKVLDGLGGAPSA